MDVVGSQNCFSVNHVWPMHKISVSRIAGLIMKRAEQQHVWPFFFLSLSC